MILGRACHDIKQKPFPTYVMSSFNSTDNSQRGLQCQLKIAFKDDFRPLEVHSEMMLFSCITFKTLRMSAKVFQRPSDSK